MSKPLKIGIIGAGGISGAHLPAYSQYPDRAQLVAVCDVREEAAHARATAAGVESIYTDPLKMIHKADLDAVDICTSHDQHAPLAIAAAEAGKHVLVEKPMACTLEECLAMLAAADRSGVTLMVAQCQRYDPTYRAAYSAIQAGELGAIRGVEIGARQNLSAFLQPGHWLFDGKQAGGGVVISVAVHKIDLARYLAGNVRSVQAVCKTTSPEWTNGAESYASAVLEFENGAVGNLFATYSAYRTPFGENVTIFGDSGAIHAIRMGEERGPAMIASDRRNAGGKGWQGQYEGFVQMEPEYGSLVGDNPFVNEILHLADCVRESKEPISSGRDNLETMKVIFGIYESARTGRSVDLAEL